MADLSHESIPHGGVQRRVADDLLAWMGRDSPVYEFEMYVLDGNGEEDARVFDLTDADDRAALIACWLDGRRASW